MSSSASSTPAPSIIESEPEEDDEPDYEEIIDENIVENHNRINCSKEYATKIRNIITETDIDENNMNQC